MLFQRVLDSEYHIEFIHPLKQSVIVELMSNIPKRITHVYVFGSSITDYCTPNSDVDVVLVMNGDPIKSEERDLMAPKGGIDIIEFMSEEEAKSFLNTITYVTLMSPAHKNALNRDMTNCIGEVFIMNGKVTLLERARCDWLQVKMNLQVFKGKGPAFLDLSAYHLHQCVEKTMKYLLANYGVEFQHTHDILVLYDQMKNNKIDVPEWLYKEASTLNRYCETTRYGLSVVSTEDKIRELHSLAGDYYMYVQKHVAQKRINSAFKL